MIAKSTQVYFCKFPQGYFGLLTFSVILNSRQKGRNPSARIFLNGPLLKPAYAWKRPFLPATMRISNPTAEKIAQKLL